MTDQPMISKVPGVCGGRACIAGSRMAVWVLEEMRRSGLTPEAILDMYPWMTREQLLAAWAYAEQFPQEISADISDNTYP